MTGVSNSVKTLTRAFKGECKGKEISIPELLKFKKDNKLDFLIICDDKIDPEGVLKFGNLFSLYREHYTDKEIELLKGTQLGQKIENYGKPEPCL